MAAEAGWNSGVFAIVTLPNLLLEASPDYVMTLRILPGGPTSTNAEVTWAVNPSARAGDDFDVQRLTEFWRLTSEQDWKLCEGNQAGVESDSYRPGPYAPSEAGVEKFVRWYIRQLAEPDS
jgi:Rieske 2Fe-2S family protein